jgi:predicted nuclease of predicted toxin-antitoxin system
MLRLLSDENFNNDIITGMLRRQPDIELVRNQDVGLMEADDPSILSWAAAEGRVVLTHDRKTFARYAFDRVRAGEPMPGVFVVHRKTPIGKAIEELLFLAVCSFDGEWEGKVLFLPFDKH